MTLNQNSFQSAESTLWGNHGNNGVQIDLSLVEEGVIGSRRPAEGFISSARSTQAKRRVRTSEQRYHEDSNYDQMTEHIMNYGIN